MIRWRDRRPRRGGDRHQLPGPPGAARGHPGDRSRHPRHERAVLAAAVGVPDRLRPHVRRGRQADGRPGHAPGLHGHHGVLVPRLRQPRAGRRASACSPSAASCWASAKAAASPPRRGRWRSGSRWRSAPSAMGIINAGTAVGMIVAPPMIALVLSARGLALRSSSSRAGSACCGRSGGAGTTSRPSGTRGSARRSAARSSRCSVRPTAASQSCAGCTLLRFRQTWGVVVAKFLSDAAWYFYLFWLPKYLYDARGFDIKAVATFAWIPPAAAGIGCLVGGWLSSRLLRENFSLDRARKIALGASAILMPLVLFVPSVPVAWAIALFSIAYFGQQSWSTLVMVLPADIYSAPGGRRGRGPRRLRRRHGRRRLRSGRGLPAGPRLRLRPRVRPRRIVPRRSPSPSSAWPSHASSRWPSIPEVAHEDQGDPHPRRGVARQDGPAAAALLHEPDGPARAAAKPPCAPSPSTAGWWSRS